MDSHDRAARPGWYQRHFSRRKLFAGAAAVSAGATMFAATSVGAGAVFAVELLQTWLPGQTAEITDPLLALCAGGLIAVFEPDGDG